MKNTILQEQITLYEQENKVLNEKLEELRLKEEKLTLEYNSYIKKAKKEAKEIVEKAQTEALELIEEIKQKQTEVKEHEIADLKHKVRKLDVSGDESVTETNFNVGDEVYVKGWQRNGRITKINKDK